jgi:ABC-type phosphate/phosphonate transport system substrate-binding protein
LLLGIADDPQGLSALQALDIDRFLPAHDQDYDPVRRLDQELGKP